MKFILTRIAVIAICAVIVVVMLPRSCSQLGTDDSRITQVFTPKDSSFAPVATKQYRPPSTPFEKQKSPVKLPSDITECQVREAVRIIGTSPDSTIDTTVIIVSRDDHIYASGGRRSLRVEQFEYLPPLLDFGFFRQIGVTVAGLRLPLSVSPCLAVSLLQIACPGTLSSGNGRFQLPTLLLDLDGVGIGAGYHFSDFSAGIMYHHPFEDVDGNTTSIRLFVTYNF